MNNTLERRCRCFSAKIMMNKKEPSIIETEKILLSVKEVCKLTGLSEKTVRTLVEENHLMVRIGRRTMVDRKKLEKWLVKQS